MKRCRLAIDRCRQRLMRLACRDEGLEAIQTVMIMAIAAICMIVIYSEWPKITQFFREAVSRLLD